MTKTDDQKKGYKGYDDISERKLKRKYYKYHIENKKYKSFFENANEAVFIADAESGNIVDCNVAAIKLTGYSKRELVGRNQRFLHPPAQHKKHELLFARHASESPRVDEAVLLTRDGREVPILIRASLLKIGRRRYIQGIFSDVSELIFVRERLKERGRQKKQLIIDLTKEIDVLLSSVRGKILGVIERQRGAVNNDVKEDINKSVEEIDKILRFARTMQDI